jgi:hypothetical protein
MANLDAVFGNTRRRQVKSMTVELELQSRPIALYVIIVALIAATAIKTIFWIAIL